MENFYYTCIYEILRRAAPDGNTLPALNRLKAKLVRLQSVRLQKILLDNDDADRLEGETPTLYNVLQMKRRRNERTTTGLLDEDGRWQTTPRGMAQILITRFRERYDKIEVDNVSIKRMTAHIKRAQTTRSSDEMGGPFEDDEIWRAIRAGGKGRAPGNDGLTREFYARTWTIIREDLRDVLNEMFWEGNITTAQKHGVIICIPKGQGGNTPHDYRPITLLNTDYKILARMVALRLQPVIQDHLSGTQFCGVPGSSIMDATAAIRDTIAYAENKGQPLCVLSLDFTCAFDRIAHDYLFQVLQSYGINDEFRKGIEHMYHGATSSVQINGQLYGTIPIRSAVRQGCPMSMALYTLCLHPLLQYLDQQLTGVKIGRSARRTAVVAYADDVTLFISAVTEFAIVEEALLLYEKASGRALTPENPKR